MKETESLNALVLLSNHMVWTDSMMHYIQYTATSLSGAWLTLAKADSHNQVSNKDYMMSTDECNSMFFFNVL